MNPDIIDNFLYIPVMSILFVGDLFDSCFGINECYIAAGA